MLTKEELTARLEKNRVLVQYTHVLLHHLFSITGDTEQLIALLDRDFYVLDYVSNISEMQNFIPHFAIGCRWEEGTVGTNACSMALAQNKPTILDAKQHSSPLMQNITEYADVIHDVHENPAALLCMFTRATVGNAHTMGLVAFATYIVENHLAMIKSHELMDNMLDTISEGLILLDEQLNIQNVSYRLCQMFEVDRDALCQHPIQDFFNPAHFQQKVFEGKKPFSYMECEFSINGKRQSYNVSVTPMYVAGKITGAILLLRESKSVNKVANIISGNYARYQFEDILTGDSKMNNIISTMKQIANSSCAVLLEGESGTGKELFAHSIHNFSSRSPGPFVAVNCASLPQSLVESELFGYEKGAFTGALNEGNPGKFELADGGTIFLDEIGELPLVMQAKLLRVLDTHRTLRIGGKAERSLNIRVIAATNRNLWQETQADNFREDLYYRISVMKFQIPPLRERKEDILLLANYFLKRLAKQENTSIKKGTPDFEQALLQYAWPGNVRELQNTISRAHYICSEETIARSYLPDNISATEPAAAVLPPVANKIGEVEEKDTAEQWERAYLVQKLNQHQGHVLNTASAIGMSKSSLYRKLKKYGIQLKPRLSE